MGGGGRREKAGRPFFVAVDGDPMGWGVRRLEKEGNGGLVA